jgi:hypothetical protein
MKLLLLIILSIGLSNKICFPQEKEDNIFSLPNNTFKLKNNKEIKARFYEDSTCIFLVDLNNTNSGVKLSKFGMSPGYVKREAFFYLIQEGTGNFLVHSGFYNRVESGGDFNRTKFIPDGTWILFGKTGNKIRWWNEVDMIHVTRDERRPKKIIAYLSSGGRDSLCFNYLNDSTKLPSVCVDLSKFSTWNKMKQSLSVNLTNYYAYHFYSFEFQYEDNCINVYFVDVEGKHQIAHLLLEDRIKLGQM